MSDLEQRLRDEFARRTDALQAWEVPGPELRHAWRVRRSRRIRAVAVAAPVVVLAASVGVWDVARHDTGADRGTLITPAVDATPSVTEAPASTDQRLDVPDALVAQAHISPFIDGGFTLLVAVKLPRSGADGLLLQGNSPSGGLMVASVSRVAGKMHAGVRARYPSDSSVIAQPIRDGKGTSFVVFAPESLGGDEASITFSTPRASAPSIVTVPMRRGLAVVPVPGPDAVTHVTVRARGRSVYDDVPASELLSSRVPRDLLRIRITSTNSSQPVQVRDNGTTACRLTAGGYWPENAMSVEWNPFDEACARINGTLQLLLADDRRYSSVAGVAPQGTSRVVLHWKDGSVSTARLAIGSLPAFVDPDYRLGAAELVKADAFDARGHLLDTAVPLNPRP